MKTIRTPHLIGLALAAGLLAGACSAGTSPTPPAATTPPDTTITPPPVNGSVDPGEPQPQFILPKPGQQNVRPVSITALTPIVDGRKVTIQADWVSGVEPCHVLDRVEVKQRGTSITIGLFEGTSDPNAVCIQIAAFKATLIDLGELEPGNYAVRSADGAAPPVSFTVK